MRKRPAWALVIMISAAGLEGCFSDPMPDPSEAPLEIVVDGCILNRPEVAPGTHDVAAASYDPARPSEVVVTGEDGTVLLTLAAGETEQLVTTDQSYTFTCTVGGDESTATLESRAPE